MGAAKIILRVILYLLPFGSNDADGSKLGGGAIAGIVVGVVAVLAVGFLIGYYKIVKPRLFSRLMETGALSFMIN